MWWVFFLFVENKRLAASKKQKVSKQSMPSRHLDFEEEIHVESHDMEDMEQLIIMTKL